MLQILKVQGSFKTLVQNKISSFRPDITFEMLHVMVKLWKEDGINQQELARRLMRDKSSLSYLLNNLENRELIRRIEDEKDKRNKLIVVSEKGEEMKSLFNPIIHEIYSDLADALDEKDLDETQLFLEQLDTLLTQP